MPMHYDKRSTTSTKNFTNCVVDVFRGAPHFGGVLTKDEFLAEIRRRAGVDAEVGRALGIPSSRVAELFSGKRGLRYDEAKILSDRFMPNEGVPSISAETLSQILAACLLRSPKGGWTAKEAPRLARAVEHGLRLLANSPANPASEDAIAVAGQAAVLQLHEGHPEA